MVSNHFDAITRSFGAFGASRRTVTHIFAGSALATVLAGFGGEGAAGKRKRRKRRRKKRKKKQANDCACSGGAHCLGNGSCAISCSDDSGCGGCLCSLATTEGEHNCVGLLDFCPTQSCQSTAECPLGTQCQPCIVGGPTVCFPLCAG